MTNIDYNSVLHINILYIILLLLLGYKYICKLYILFINICDNNIICDIYYITYMILNI